MNDVQHHGLRCHASRNPRREFRTRPVVTLASRWLPACANVGQKWQRFIRSPRGSLHRMRPISSFLAVIAAVPAIGFAQPPASTPPQSAAAATSDSEASAPQRLSQVPSLSREVLLALGAKSYQRYCSACHQSDGRGVVDARISSLHQSPLVNGSNGSFLRFVMFNELKMQHAAWYLAISPADLASALTYIRLQFPNASQELVQPGEVIDELKRLPAKPTDN